MQKINFNDAIFLLQGLICIRREGRKLLFHYSNYPEPIEQLAANEKVAIEALEKMKQYLSEIG